MFEEEMKPTSKLFAVIGKLILECIESAARLSEVVEHGLALLPIASRCFLLLALSLPVE